MYPIEVAELVKSFRQKRKRKVIVDDVSFKVKKNEIFGLLGPNGAGKTTIINILAGLLTEDSGEIRILGHRPEENWEHVRNRMNVSTAYFPLSDVLTVEQNLKVYARLFGIKNVKEKIDELLSIFELSSVRKQRVLKLSSGERTRVTLCKGLINDPEVLLLDECTVGLDPDIAEKTRNIIKQYHKHHDCSMLFTSHYMYEVEELCNRIAFLNKGKIVKIDTAENLKRLIKNQTVEIAVKEKSRELKEFLKTEGLDVLLARQNTIIFEVTSEDEKLYKTMNKIFAKGFRLTDLHIQKPTLNDIFIKFAREGKDEAP
ncbi:MAG: ABC transporter ATP-binding protein [Nanoarchaeota archaeon]|nr:ABC transporter ATP-binding protein [Nanoarchaeota archaeon]